MNMSSLSGLSGLGMSKTFSLGPPKKKGMKVPKLDFSTLKHNKEFKDWYKYATKLELSVKSLRKKIKDLETEMDECSQKNVQLRKQNSNLYALNRKLVLTTKSLKKKIVEMKERYNKKIKKAQKFGLDTLEMTIPRFDTDVTYDYSTNDIPKEYMDEFNSNDSYGDAAFRMQTNAYESSKKSKTLLIDEGEARGRVHTQMQLDHNDSIENDNILDKFNQPMAKPAKRLSETIKMSNDYQNSNPLEDQEKEDFLGVAKPNLGYKKKGLITKVNINDHNRDLLAGRKRVIKKTKFNRNLATNKGRNRSVLD